MFDVNCAKRDNKHKNDFNCHQRRTWEVGYGGLAPLESVKSMISIFFCAQTGA